MDGLDSYTKFYISSRFLFIFVICLSLCDGILHRRTLKLYTTKPRNDIEYKTLYFQQKVDHFGYANQDTYKQRYLVQDKYWDPEAGPIFFYTGNEGDITWFCNNTGLMWDWAPTFKALLVFAEHRYYGESLPYGEHSYMDLPRLGYLTSEQALADFVTLIDHIKSAVPGAGNKPVIAMGGSYGGMLAAWFRMKYPHIVEGSLAASAPIWQFGDLVPQELFYQKVTNDFKRESDNCAKNIAASWSVISETGKTAAGCKILRQTFSLCDPLKTEDIPLLKSWLSGTYVNLAMVDYPYAADFLEPLPAWPIKEVCKHLSSSSLSSKALIEAVAAGVKVYYNYTGSSQCLEINQQATQDLGDKGWDFQACTEMVMPMSTDGQSDMFEPQAWDYQSYADNCKTTWGVTPQPSWILKQFGGKNISTASNIIFSNGGLDPWSAGGVMTSLSDSLVAILIPEGAHHLDLRSSHPDDPPSVIAARQKEKEIIQGWIKGYWNGKMVPT